MRASAEKSGTLFSDVDLESRIPAKHPLQTIRAIVNKALAALDGDFGDLYSEVGRPSIPPEHLLRAILLQIFYAMRSERLLVERLDFDQSFRCSLASGLTIGFGMLRLSRRTATACSTGTWRCASSPPSSTGRR